MLHHAVYGGKGKILSVCADTDGSKMSSYIVVASKIHRELSLKLVYLLSVVLSVCCAWLSDHAGFCLHFHTLSA